MYFHRSKFPLNNISLFALLTCLSFSACQAGNAASMSGEGRNGPHLTGPAAPISFDRSFEPEELQKAMLQCSTDLMKSLYSQFFRRSWTDATVSSAAANIGQDDWKTELGQDGQPRWNIVGFSGTVTNKKGSTMSVGIDQYGGFMAGIDYFNSSDRPARLEVDIDFKEGDVPGVSGDLLFAPPWGFSAFEYERVLSDLKYDDLGNLVSSKVTTGNLYFRMPGRTTAGDPVHGVPVDGTAIPLYQIIRDGRSGQAGGMTKVTVDIPGFRSCLLGELQN